MSASVYAEVEFVALILFSLIIPVAAYGYMLTKRAISRKTVLAFGAGLVSIAGVSVVLLLRLSDLAQRTPSMTDDFFFHSEVTMALYLVPALFAGIGANLISHVLISHLSEAEKRYDNAHREGLSPNIASLRSDKPRHRHLAGHD